MAQAAAAVKSGMKFDDEEANREPFAAYVADAASQAAAQSVAELRGWPASSVRKGGLPAALRLLGIAPPPRMMIIDIEGLPIEEVEQGLVELTRLGSMVIALGAVNDVSYFRRIMRAGVRDYLVKPVDTDMLSEIFVRLEQPGDGTQALGRVIGVLGARGGVGVTTLAINLAWIMAEKLGRRTALVDMDIYAGNIALSLDIEPTRGLREAFDDPERVDEVFLQNAMHQFGKGLHVLATEEGFDDTVRMTDDKVLMLADTMRSNFDMSVLDVPRHFVVREPQLFTRFDDVLIVAELTLESLRDANRMLRLLKTRNRNIKVHIVANRVVAKPDIAIREFEAGTEAKLRCAFSFDAKAIGRSAVKGKPLAVTEPAHKLVQDLHGLCIELAGVPGDSRPKGFFRRRKKR